MPIFRKFALRPGLALCYLRPQMKFIPSFAVGIGAGLLFLWSSGFQFVLPNLFGTIFLVALVGTTFWLRSTSTNRSWFPAFWIGFVACYIVGVVAGAAFSR